MKNQIIPLFPLELVLFPGVSLPLHIFEERYKEMIRDCREKHRPFGIVLYENGQIYLVGCTAGIRKVLKKYRDGRMDILVEGEQRFIVEEVIEQKAYLQAKVSLFEPLDPANSVDNELHQEAIALMKQVLKITEKKIDLSLFQTLNSEQISFLIAAYAGFSTIQKQVLLEINDVSERLNAEVKFLQVQLERLQLNQLLQKALHKNGKPQH